MVIMLTTDKNPLNWGEKKPEENNTISSHVLSSDGLQLQETEEAEGNNEMEKQITRLKCWSAFQQTNYLKTKMRSNELVFIPIADCSEAGIRPPVDFLVQGSSVSAVTRRERAALQVMMIVLVDMQVGPVYLFMCSASYRHHKCK